MVRPYQSHESMFRCFLLANSGLPLKSLRKELRATIQEKNTNQHYTNLKSAPIEKLFRLAVDQLEKYDNFSTSRWRLERRCCAICSKSGYHSEIYDFLWLNKCPIHPDEALTLRCPRCTHPWFSYTKPTCSICGISISIKSLSKSQAFDFSGIEKLQELYACLSVNAQGTSSMILKSGLEKLRMSGWRCACSPSSKYFPSLIAAVYPVLADLFLDYGVRLHKCRITKIKITQKLGDREYKDALWAAECRSMRAESWEEASRTRISVMIRRCLKDTHGHNHDIDRYTSKMSHWAEDPYSCSYCAAYNIWEEIISVKRGEARSRFWLRSDMIYRHYFQCLAPEPPVPLAFLTSESRASDKSEDRENYRVPLSIQQAIYELDLWTCFFSVCTLMKFHAQMDRLGPRSQGYVRDIPEAAYPQKAYCDDVAFFIDSNKQFNLIVPDALMKHDTWSYSPI